ncbi:hypothetical protein MAR_000673, partial [Mya arenaria]
EPLARSEFLEVKGTLMVSLLLENFKRAGDLYHLTRSAVLQARAGDEEAEMFVIQHKEAASGKRCPVEVSAERLESLQLFARLP